MPLNVVRLNIMRESYIWPPETLYGRRREFPNAYNSHPNCHSAPRFRMAKHHQTWSLFIIRGPRRDSMVKASNFQMLVTHVLTCHNPPRFCVHHEAVLHDEIGYSHLENRNLYYKCARFRSIECRNKNKSIYLSLYI